MPRRDPHSSHDQENHERWLISYSDFITLLFAFFVVMYSISSVNEGKYKVLSKTLIGAFDVVEKKQTSSSNLVELGEYVKNSLIDFPGQSNKEGDLVDTDQAQKSQLGQLSEQVESAFADLIEDKVIAINGNETWVEISLSSGLLFGSGSATPSAAAQPILEEIAGILSGYKNPIRVEGFTDNVPISSTVFPSNWELSSARSATVVRLLAQAGVEADRMAAIGYGEYQPVASNETAEGRNENRRVVLVVSKDLDLRRTASGAGEPTAESAEDNTFLKEKNNVKTLELEGGGLLFTKGEKKK